MDDTLYEQLILTDDLENVVLRLKYQINNLETDYKKMFGSSPFEIELKELDKDEVQKAIIQNFKENQIIKDVFKGKSIEESLNELGEKYKGWRRFTPKRKDIIYNQKLEEMEQVIGPIRGWKTEGILAPNNFISGAAYVTAGIFLLGYVLSQSIRPAPNVSPEEFQKGVDLLQLKMPLEVSSIFAPLLGYGFQTARVRPKEILIKEAKYIDNKIQLLYKS